MGAQAASFTPRLEPANPDPLPTPTRDPQGWALQGGAPPPPSRDGATRYLVELLDPPDQVRVAGRVLEVDVVCKRARARQPRESASRGAGPPLAHGLAASVVAGGGQAQAGGWGAAAGPEGTPRAVPPGWEGRSQALLPPAPETTSAWRLPDPGHPPMHIPRRPTTSPPKTKELNGGRGFPGGGDTELAGAGRGRGPRGAGS